MTMTRSIAWTVTLGLLLSSFAFVPGEASAQLPPKGSWKVNGNGFKGVLVITGIAYDGKVYRVNGTIYGQQLVGTYDLKTRRLDFLRVQKPKDPSSFQSWSGYMFWNKEGSGRITYTFAGTATPFGPAGGVGRSGWYAQITTTIGSAQDQPTDEKQKEATYNGKTVSQWMEALKDNSIRNRRGAVFALGQIGPAAKDAVPALIEALKDKDGKARVYAASALAKIDPASKDAVPALIGALKDKDGVVRSAAASALCGIRPLSKDLVPALIGALKNDKSSGVRRAAADGLGGIGPVSKDVVPALIEALKDKEGLVVRRSAVYALGRIGPAAKDAVPALKSLSAIDPASGVRSSAKAALIKIVK